VLEAGLVSEAYQALRASVNDTNEQETDRKPVLSVLNVEIPEGYDPQFLYKGDAKAADSRLDAQ
jgi:hypothetical protein